MTIGRDGVHEIVVARAGRNAGQHSNNSGDSSKMVVNGKRSVCSASGLQI